MDPVSIIVLAVIAVFSSVTAPLLIMQSTARTRRRERLEDYAHQDRLAAEAAEAAEAAVAATRVSNGKLDQLSAQAAQIHSLVNSDMTAARQAELDQTRSLLTVLRRVVSITADKGQPPDPADVQAIENAIRRVTELERVLSDRLAQFREAERNARNIIAGRDLDDDGDQE